MGAEKFAVSGRGPKRQHRQKSDDPGDGMNFFDHFKAPSTLFGNATVFDGKEIDQSNRAFLDTHLIGKGYKFIQFYKFKHGAFY